MTSTDGKVVAVTGAASGLGACCAALLAERGATVIGIDRIHASPPPEGSWATLDLADVDAIAPAFGRIVADHGRLDGLVNAAGVMDTRRFAQITPPTSTGSSRSTCAAPSSSSKLQPMR